MNIEKFADINEWVKPILSTALHDIYNEINNLFFLSESMLWDNHQQNHENFQRDFFNIINQIKGKQFIFNNLFSEKILELSEIQKLIGPLALIKYNENYSIPINIFCLLLLIINDNFIFLENNQIKISIKPKFIDEFKKEENFWAIKVLLIYLKKYEYSYSNQDNFLIIQLN